MTSPSSTVAVAQQDIALEQLPGGRIRLENRILQIDLDPVLAGGASSIVHQPSGKQLAVCDSYGERTIPAFYEGLHLQPMREGRLDVVLPEYRCVKAAVEGQTAVVQFRGCPLDAATAGKADAAEYRKLTLTKTSRLTAGQSRLTVELQLASAAAVDLPVALWIGSGQRVRDEDVDVLSPGPGGTQSELTLWNSPMSVIMNVPRAAAPWSAAVARDAGRTGMYLCGEAGRVESICNWLGKFPGFTLGMGTPLVTLKAGGMLAYRYDWVATAGQMRVDAADRQLCGGIVLASEKPRPGQELGVGLWLCSPVDAAIRAHMVLRKLGEMTAVKLGRSDMVLAAGQAQRATFVAALTGPGAYVLTARVTLPDGSVQRIERPVTIMPARQEYRSKIPALKGKSIWRRQVGDKPLPAFARQCDRRRQWPMIPWANPSPGPRLKVLMLGELSYNTAIYRDLARRGDWQWDFVNLFGLGDMCGGPYGQSELTLLKSKLRRLQPDCVLTAGLRFAAMPLQVLEQLREYVRGGGGLVIVGRSDEEHLGLWSGLLQDPEVRPDVSVDLAGRWQGIFEAGIAPPPLGQAEALTLGKGRLILLDKQLDWPQLGLWGDPAPRNDLLPRYRGQTRLPDWEYHFAQYVHLVRHAANWQSPARLLAVGLQAGTVEVRYQAEQTVAAAVEVEVISADRLRAQRRTVNVQLQAGGGSATLPLTELPGGRYVVHAWLLAGPVANETAEHADVAQVDSFLFRSAHPQPVLDFLADCQEIAGSGRIESIAIDNPKAAEPGGLTVTATAPAGSEVEVEWHNGGHGRVVWQGRQPLASNATARFAGINFPAVSHEGGVVVRLLQGATVLAEKGQIVTAWRAGNVAEDDVAYLTAAGGEHDWYGTQMIRSWAQEEAGLDFTYLRYGLPSGGFPWKRGKNCQLEPPIVDETPLREQLRVDLKRFFEEEGNAYLCMRDEFRLGGEYDWSEATLSAFRVHLQARYGAIAALNEQWGTQYQDFAQATPLWLEEAQRQSGNPSAWVDFRLFMDEKVNRRFEVAQEEAAAISPLLRVGDSGAYAPSYQSGIHFHRLMQSSRFTMTYTGLRSEWVRSFRKPDSVVGVWLGYGWEQPQHPWETLLQQYQVLAWWGYMVHKRLIARGMAGIELDLSPRKFAAIGKQQAEIRRGLGKLILGAAAAPAPVAIPYSQTSVYTADVLQQGYSSASNVALQMAQRRNLAVRFVADEEVAAGQLAHLPAKVLLFPGIDALTDASAQGYGQAIEGGRFALADIVVGGRDGSGKVRATGALDPVFGLRRGSGSEEAPRQYESIYFTEAAPAALQNSRGQLIRALSGVDGESGCVWARFRDGTAAVLGRKTTGGSLAILVNTRMSWSALTAVSKAFNPEDRPDELSPAATVEALFTCLLQEAQVQPDVVVEAAAGAGPGAGAPRATMIRRFDDGLARYYGLLLKGAGAATLHLPQRLHTYDMRRGRYLGEVDQVAATWRAGDLAGLYAQLPYRVTALQAQFTAGPPAAGQVVQVRGQVRGSSAVTQRHVVHVELTLPDGSRPLYYRANVSAPGGAFSWEFPLPLNPSSGQWKLDLRDAATGASKTLRFVL